MEVAFMAIFIMLKPGLKFTEMKCKSREKREGRGFILGGSDCFLYTVRRRPIVELSIEPCFRPCIGHYATVSWTHTCRPTYIHT